MINYFAAVGLSGDLQKEYDLWAWLFREHAQNIRPKWYARHAIAANNADHYDLAITLGKKAVLTCESVQPILHGLIGNACYLLEKYDQAEKSFQEYFSSVKEENAIPDFLSSYAYVCYHFKKYKAASHYMGLYLQHASPQMIQAGDYASAAIYAFRNGDCAKAEAHWEKYFSCDPDQHDSDNLAIAGEFYSQQDNYKRSIELLEAYFKKAKKERWNKKYVLVLGYNYHMVGKHKQACKYHNSIFVDNEIQKEYLADIPPAGYGIIAQSYLCAGEPIKVEKVLKLFSQSHPNCQVLLTLKKEEVSAPTNQKRGRGRGRGAASREVSRPVASETPAQRIRALLKASTLEKCDEMLNALELMSFEEMPETQLCQEERLSLVEKAVAFKDRVLNEDIQKANESQATSKWQQEVTQLERQMSALKQKHHKMERARVKKHLALYWEKRRTEEEEFMPLPGIENLRALYGHKKVSTASSENAEGPDTETTTTTTTTQPAPTAPTKQVTFYLLKSADKHYATIQSMPGMRGKYKNFIKELMEDPFSLEGGSGKPEQLYGEAGLYSRRFDKKNRFVYLVRQTGEHTYDVTILSLLGHYKHLETQLQSAKNGEKGNGA